MIVLSPHLDDAVFSCGALLALWHPSVVVATICAGIPDETTGPGPFDIRSGFRSGAEAVTARRAEDLNAMRAIGATAVHLDVLDGAYGSEEPIAAAVDQLLAPRPDGEVVLCPLGLHHPDHEAVACAFERQACRFRAWWYAELPYFQRFPAELEAALERRGVDCDPVTVPWSEAKGAAMALYPSQLVDTDLGPYRTPERFYPC